MTPCLFLNADGTPRGLRVCSDVYFETRIILEPNSRSGMEIFVKRRQGESPPLGCKEILLPPRDSSTGILSAEMEQSPSKDERFLSFTKRIYDSWQDNGDSAMSVESAVKNSEDALLLRLSLHGALETCQVRWFVWDVRLIRSYLQATQSYPDSARLLRSKFVASMVEVIESAFVSQVASASDWQSVDKICNLGPILCWFGLQTTSGRQDTKGAPEPEPAEEMDIS